mgnify:CR=1 FL=1
MAHVPHQSDAADVVDGFGIASDELRTKHVLAAATRRREKVAAVEGSAAWPLAESSTRANHDYHAFA